MPKIAIIGAGITGITSAYFLQKAGHEVVVIDRHRYPAMETSFANGGQLSACNAEVWNSAATLMKAMRWLFRCDAPLLFNPAPGWHKYSWIAEFLWAIRHHRENSIRTVKLAIDAREHVFSMAADEGIDFDLERRGILHIFHDRGSFDAGMKTTALLAEGGLERRAVSPEEIHQIEPTLAGNYYAGIVTPSDATGDIHKFTRGLADACIRKGLRFVPDAPVEKIQFESGRFRLVLSTTGEAGAQDIEADKVVVCAGVESRRIASMLGDRVNVYPVKGYSITVNLNDPRSQQAAPMISLLDEEAKIVTSRLGRGRFRVAGTAELNGFNRDIRQDRIDPLLRWVRTNFPEVGTSSVIPWAGLRPMMPDMMPVVRPGYLPGVFYNTGHGHLGWTLSAATAALLAQMI